MAVFSKTSIQSLHIEPANPRVLFFNDAVSVGWVRGGFIELATQDPGDHNALHYYILLQRPGERLTRREDCVRCHQSGFAQLRSVVSTSAGVPSDEIDVDSRTPFSRLWGGWFVTGSNVPPGHMGNAVFAKSERQELQPNLDAKFSLARSSDVVALMVFAHQMHMMNLLAHPDNVNELVDYLLFIDEVSTARSGAGKLSLRGGVFRRRPSRSPGARAARFRSREAADAISVQLYDLHGRLRRVASGHEGSHLPTHVAHSIRP